MLMEWLLESPEDGSRVPEEPRDQKAGTFMYIPSPLFLTSNLQGGQRNWISHQWPWFSQSWLCNEASTENPHQGFPGGSVVKNLPAKARDPGLIPGRGSSHMSRSSWAHEPQLSSLCSRGHAPPLLKPMHPRACAPQQEKPPQGGAHTAQQRIAPAHGNQESLHSNKEPARPKINKWFKKERQKEKKTLTKGAGERFWDGEHVEVLLEGGVPGEGVDIPHPPPYTWP